MSLDDPAAGERVVKRFYEEHWNRWRFDLADDILAHDVTFRASLGTTVTGREQFKPHLEGVRAAFPNWHRRIDEIWSVSNRVATRMTYSGTHSGKLRDIEPTGARVEYVGADFFTVTGGLIQDAWVVGDTQEFWRALGRL